MFTKEEKRFIVKSFGRNPSPTKVRQDFLRHYNVQKGRKRDEYKPYHFARVNKEFEKNSSVTEKSKKRSCSKRTQENIDRVKTLIKDDLSVVSTREAAPKMDLSSTTLWRILKWDLKAKFYRVACVQVLSEAHKEQRRQFCEWFIAQDQDFAQKVIWTDEKIFVLKQKPHRQNIGVWANSNPHLITESNDRNGLKVMIFVAVVNGKIPIVHPFITEEGRSLSVNGSVYHDLLQEKVWPTFRSSATRQQLWWMQDGAPAHCTNEAKTFLLEKFQGRVISRGTDRAWPAHSPDLNPLDFHFWSAAQRQVYRSKPENIDGLVQVVRDFAANYDQTTIKRVSANVLKRARICLRADGGHFQHLL